MNPLMKLFFPTMFMSFADDDGSAGGGGDDGGSAGGAGDDGGSAGGADDGGTGDDGSAGKAGEPKEFKIPDQYKDKGWASKVKSEEDLYKQIDTLDSMKGKKEVAFDYENATDEEKAAHHSLYRPEKAEDYVIKVEEGEDQNEAVASKMKEVFHKNGLHQSVVDDITKGFQEIRAETISELFDPEKYDAMLQEKFGADFKKEAGFAANVFKEFATDDEKAMFDKGFSNQQASVMLGVIHKIAKAYGVNETDIGAGGGAGGGGSNPVEKIEAKISAIRQDIANMPKRPHTEAEKKAKIKELTDLTAQRMKFQAQQK